jgi:class 3 adenylate cyclase
MDTPATDAPEPVILIIADISGYTRYMTANAKTLAHSQVIITELVKAIVRAVELPVEVAKLEGDAVFLYCRKQHSSQSWPEMKRVIGGKLLAFFHNFSEKVNELSRSTTCSCHACAHIEKLRLKVVVHSGEALFHRVFNFLELAGVDVIIAHRLLKNSIAADQYLLLTPAARQDVEFAKEIHLTGGSETYDDIGRIETLVYLPDGGTIVPVRTSFAERFGKSWRLFCKFWFAPLVPKSCGHGHKFHHIICDTGGIGRTSFAVLTLLLTPIFLPVGTIFVFLHALKRP